MDFLNIQNWKKRLRGRIYTALIRTSAGKIDEGSKIHPPFHANNIKGLYIGKKCSVQSYGWIDCVSEYAGQKLSPRIEIGDNTYIGHRVHIIACLEMKIGKNVVIADGVYIADNNFDFEDISVPVMKSPLKIPGPIVIEDEAWLGEGVSVMPNVTIGKHSVIGANSVVTKSIPPYSVAVGVPARIIKCFNKESGQWETVE